MSYSKIGPFVDGGPPYLSAADLNRLEQGVIDANRTIAPPPSGDTTGVADTANLQPLITAAQNGGGTLILQAGTYYTTGLSTTQGNFQPRILGQGRQYTFVQAVGTATVFTIQGNSGAVTAGEISELAVVGPTASTTAPTNVGIEIIGACGVKIDVEFRYLAVGLRLHNRDAGMFTEFCVATDCVWTFVTTALHYKVTSGNESFHGSGIRGGIIDPTNGSTGPIIQIDAGCFPYNAPLSPTVFPNTAGSAIILNSSTSRVASFFGDLRVECQGASGTNVVSTGSASNVYLAGNVLALGGILRFGRLYLANKIYFDGTALVASLKPWQRYTTLGGPTTGVTNSTDPFAGNGTSLIALVILNTDSSYYYRATLLVFVNAGSGAGLITNLASTLITDSHTYAAPTFGWASGSLTVTNTNFGTSFAATVSVTPLGGEFGSDNLGQY